jgi:hypothetical protein
MTWKQLNYIRNRKALKQHVHHYLDLVDLEAEVELLITEEDADLWSRGDRWCQMIGVVMLVVVVVVVFWKWSVVVVVVVTGWCWWSGVVVVVGKVVVVICG